MPQINRIRVNNVKYNFGTQFYDDFVMRFSCRNTIYDLANGGGKSVLMLLLMQNLIPNCTLDEKQPVEKLFRGTGASTTIHSLIEWKLDECDRHDGYVYMTTGFCARKAGGNSDENEDRENSGIEYFNYCIFYREYGPNDIKNLPLVSDGERITYNGLKSYLRDLRKKDPGVEVFIFDRKGDYQNFISRYGLYESQWEIIRGINKTEGHVRTYFESRYKTTRKVVEDLLIEEIIEKSYNNRIKEDSSDNDDMAQTLLDVRDRLSDLMRKKSERDSYEKQIELLTDFENNTEDFTELFGKKAAAENEIRDCYAVCRKIISDSQSKEAELKSQCEEYEEKLRESERTVALAEIEEEYRELDSACKSAGEASEDSARAAAESENLKKTLQKYELAADYEEYLSYRKKYDEARLLLNAETSSSDAKERLSVLAAARKKIYDRKMKKLSESKENLIKRQEELKSEFEDASSCVNRLYGEISETKGTIDELKRCLEKQDRETSEFLSQCGLITADGISDEADKNSEKISEAERISENCRKMTADCDRDERELVEKLAECRANVSQCENRIREMSCELEASQNSGNVISGMADIYGGNDASETLASMERVLTALQDDRRSLENEESTLIRYNDSIINHRIPDYDKEMQKLMKYLKQRYEGVMSGREYLEKMTPEDAQKAINELPILPYVIIAGSSYDEISRDETVHSFDLGLHIVPIIPENYRQTGSELSWAYRKLDYLWEESALNAEKERISEEQRICGDKLKRLYDREKTVHDDIISIQMAMRSESPDVLRDRCNALKEEVSSLRRNESSLSEQLDEVGKKRAEYASRYERAQADITNYRKRADLYEMARNAASSADEISARLSLAEDTLLAKRREHRIETDRKHDRENKLSECRRELATVIDEIKTNESIFDRDYRPYLSEVNETAENLTEEEIDAESGALRKQLFGEQTNEEEKKRLINEYGLGMKKYAEKLKYGGISADEAEKLSKDGKLATCSIDEMMALKEKIKNADMKASEAEKCLLAQISKKNRIEGGIELEIRHFEEKFGGFARKAFEDPHAAAARYKQEIAEQKTRIRDTQKKAKELENARKAAEMMEHELKDLTEEAEIELPDRENIPQMAYEELENSYRQARADYKKILRKEDALREKFEKEKAALTRSLEENNAYELASEIQRSVGALRSPDDVKRLRDGIEDTCRCIRLECDRVERSMCDMEQIKDSFEDRCIQICTNIRTELDRLPELSQITLDGRRVPMITLSIPYVKEEMYRERMSVYIDETVSGAETLDDREEKIKYIRNRLSWKRLFSVIVTDMNSIRLCLYKREHISEQSRYLRYEEAVGSTGQSQGIYIQFLIAVINYISSINSFGKNASVSGKTIFIDNPFGAAKDVYIWEPIFKLLKTNHVQMIVPARGVTPAITKLFDVNYVLGQKLCGGKQQTVVTDYRSEADVSELEYAPLEYHQGTFDFEHML